MEAGLGWPSSRCQAGGCQLWLGESSFANSGGETLSDNMILHIKCAESRYCLCTIDISRQYLHSAYLHTWSVWEGAQEPWLKVRQELEVGVV